VCPRRVQPITVQDQVCRPWSRTSTSGNDGLAAVGWSATGKVPRRSGDHVDCLVVTRVLAVAVFCENAPTPPSAFRLAVQHRDGESAAGGDGASALSAEAARPSRCRVVVRRFEPHLDGPKRAPERTETHASVRVERADRVRRAALKSRVVVDIIGRCSLGQRFLGRRSCCSSPSGRCSPRC
jgi:hypothetical protein